MPTDILDTIDIWWRRSGDRSWGAKGATQQFSELMLAGIRASIVNPMLR